MNKVELFKQATVKMANVYAAKNHDYGDSFSRLRQRYPISILIRLADKLNRLDTLLTGNTAKVKDESIDDTLIDLANYAIMELVERQHEREVNHDNK
jgi:glutaredoxin 2